MVLVLVLILQNGAPLVTWAYSSAVQPASVVLVLDLGLALVPALGSARA